MERGGVGGRVISVVLLKHPPDPDLPVWVFLWVDNVVDLIEELH